MLKLLGQKYKKPIALLIISLFYADFLGQLHAAIISARFTGSSEINFSSLYFNNFLTGVTTPADNHLMNNQPLELTAMPPAIAATVVNNSKENASPEIGPTQPETSSFQSAGTDNMVDLFSGGFSYNIPLLDAGGDPISIHYNSGVTMDQEASWVGLGWNINPGAISRTMRGLPDDFNGEDYITKTESIKDNKTVSVNGSINVELIGNPDLKKMISAGMEVSAGVFYNSYMGWGMETGVSPSISSNIAGGKNAAGILTGGLSLTSNSMYGVSISPSLSFSVSSEEKKRSIGVGIGTSYNNRTGISALQLHGEFKQAAKAYEKSRFSTSELQLPVSSYISFATPTYTPTMTMPFKNTAYSFTGKTGGEIWGVSPGIGLSGSVQKQTLAYNTKSFPAYGYMHYTKSMENPEALMDFNREKELAFNSESTPHIALPVYTPDVFSISGEGTGGMFRAYRGDIGYIRDHKMQTSSGSDKLSVDVGAGGYVHVGTDLMLVDASTTNDAWKEDNQLEPKLKFSNNDTTYESVYFKNPGEQTSVDENFYAAIGDDDMLRASLSGTGENVSVESRFEKIRGGGINDGYVDVTAPILRKERDKRTQLITYFTGEQASSYGFNKKIFSYPENIDGQNAVVNIGGEKECLTNITEIPRNSGIRKSHHISEIDVLGTDGKKYVYGIPVYTTSQQDVTFSVAKQSTYLDKGLIPYTSANTSVSNNIGKEGYYSRQEVPAYAHSFLLTEILSPDYVDIRGDGVTDDDLGDAIRFNYTQVCTESNPFQWRIPYSSQRFLANYNEGLKSYNRDDKGSYAFGKKELWYLNSIESKNFVAVFYTSKDRADVLNTIDSAGGLVNDVNRSQRRLERIDLFSKADWIKNGASAKPVKSVRFDYDYSLCKGVSGDPLKGKLTLKAIWFRYNNGKWKNPYKFNYTGQNPNYNPARYDRWGNYKDITDNPEAMDNYDFPYVKQDSAQSASNVAAWSMTEILLPAGGKIKVTYESDDYGYVQNKRASRLFKIDGFGTSSASTANKNIYEAGGEKFYAFATLPVSVSDDEQLKARYFEGITKLFFKLNVPMPNTDKWGSGNEWIPLYTDIVNVGLVSGSNTRIWIQVKDVDGMSPFKKVAMQFLRLNIPSKAYPNSETGDNVSFNDMIKVVFSSITQYRQLFSTFEGIAERNNWCKEVVLNKSFVRLNEPTLKRYGGGLRVKRIEIFDNWNPMTAAKQQSASYGQEYNYTTTQTIGSNKIQISSGVASYEPQIGGDENPFRIAKELKEKTNLLAPVNLMYSEEPLGESFFPSAMVGYSKVRVRTIHSKQKSANGWSETEFYTAKDFPTLTEMTPLDESSKKAFRSKLTEFLKIDSRQFMNVSQGFKIELNDMNGKMKSQSSYAETDSLNPIQYTGYFYKVDNEKADRKHLNNDVSIVSGVNGEIKSGIVGKDIEVMIDLREQLSKTTSLNVGVNVDVIPGGLFPIPMPSAIPFPQKEIMRFRSAAVVKVINRYALLDSVVHIDKGSIVSTKNIVWDGESGQVVVSRTNNEFNDPVFNLSYPAYWAYDGMAGAYSNIGLNLGSDLTGKSLKIIKGKMFDYDNNPVPEWEKFFRSGDEIIVQRDFEENTESITPMMMSMSLESEPPVGFDPALCGDPEWRTARDPYIKIWAIDAGLGKEKHKGIYFIDREGRPYSCKEIKEFRIIRSGRRNMTAASAGSIISLADPLRVVSGVNRIQVDAQTKVLQASVATFKDLWKVVNHWYLKDSSFVREENKSLTLTPTRSLLTKRVLLSTNNGKFGDVKISERSYTSPYFVASNAVEYYRNNRVSIRGRGGYFYDAFSLIDFDIKNKILASDPNFFRNGNTVYNAVINFNALVPSNLWSMPIDAPGCGGKRDDGCLPSWISRTYAHASTGNLGGTTNNVVLKNLIDPWTSSPLMSSILKLRTGAQVSLGTMPHNTSGNKLNFSVLPLVNEALSSVNTYGFRFGLLNMNTMDQNVSERTQSYAIPSSISLSYHNFKTIDTFVCKQYISDTVVNPYRFGILGNWRPDKNYVYYSERDNRRENDLALASIDLRRDGVLTTFAPFWQFTASGIVSTTDTSQWAWTSGENFFTRKGYEMENYDALNRYNSGQYGYNEQLAVAATQNAKARESFFEGFEDYNYKTNSCNYLCKDTRVFDGFALSSDDSHTGLYSVSLTANQNKTVTLPLTNKADTAANLSIKVDSTLVLKETAFPKGTGLPGTYKACGVTANRTDPMINFNWAEQVPSHPSICATGWTEMKWTGKLQAPYSDWYFFSLNYSGGRSVSYSMKVNGLLVASNISVGFPLFLQTGRLYNIEIIVATERSKKFRFQKTDHYTFSLAASWRRLNNMTSEIIPQKVLYPLNGDTTGSYKKENFYCVKLNKVKPESVVLPKLAPIRGTKSVVTAWVKIKDDHNNTTNNTGMAPVKVQYTGVAGSDITLNATGVRIEGWQRYEGVTDIPLTATAMQLVFQPGSNNILVDDIRIHPFNSNMKSFVYDPVSLRLMAELDENNYSTYYEYDDQGNLIRLKKETEKGIMTIKETRQNTQTIVQ